MDNDNDNDWIDKIMLNGLEMIEMAVRWIDAKSATLRTAETELTQNENNKCAKCAQRQKQN